MHTLPRLLFFFLLLSWVSALRAQVPTGYAYMRPIVINNPNATAIPDLQMEFDLATDALVSAGKMQADGDDIAFMDSCSELFYWIEDSSFNTTITTFWVKIPSVPPGTHTIYMYYGDPSASANPKRNGDSTFVFFDDFNTGVSPNLAKWNLVSNNGNDVHTLTPAGFYVPTANTSNLAIGLAHPMTAGNYEVGTKFHLDILTSPIIDFDPDVGWFQATVLNVNRVATWYNDDEFPRDYTTANGAGTVYTNSNQTIHGIWSYPRIRTIGNQVTTRRYSHFPVAFNMPGPSQNFTTANAANLYVGSTAYQGVQGMFDFIFVRNAVANEPTLVLQAEQPNPWAGYAGLQPSGNTTVCPNSILQLNVNPVNGATYAWTGPGNITGAQAQLTVPNPPVGMYTVEVTSGGACISDSVPVTPIVFAPPGNDTIFCGNAAPVTLGGPPLTDVEYQWTSIPPGFSSSASSITVNPATTTSYVLLQSSANGACMVFDTITVTISPQPQAAFSAGSTPGQPDVQISNQSQNADQYEWFFGDGYMSTATNPDYSYAGSGDYVIELIATTDEGCADTAWQLVSIESESTLYVPNSFTPNGDGKNEVFYVNGYNLATLDVMIFDRWGHLITEWNTMDGSWDGKLKGRECPIGVYVYVLYATGLEGREYRQYGHVSIIR